MGTDLSSADRGTLEALRQRLQRDINCLSDPDRSTKRRALTKLQKQLIQETQPTEPVLRAFLLNYLAAPLTALLHDPVEKCREIAGSLLLAAIQQTADVPGDTAALAARIMSAATARLAMLPFTEPAEEIRLLVLRLLSAVVERSSFAQWGGQAVPELSAVLAHALQDPFPDSKRECCQLACRLCTAWPGRVRMHAEALLRPLALNLGHQHSKTRQLTLQAMGAVLGCGADSFEVVMKEVVLPHFSRLLFDRSPAVRVELARVAADLLLASFGVPDDESAAAAEVAAASASALRGHQPALLLLLLGCLADSAPEAADIARLRLDGVGAAWVACGGASCLAGDGGDAGDDMVDATMADAVGEGEAGGPGRGARLLCVALLGKVLPPTLNDASHWTERTRERALHVLRYLIDYVGDHVTPHVPKIVGILTAASADQEAEVRRAADECAKALARALLQPAALTDMLLPVLRGEVSGQATNQHVTQSLLVLQPFLAECAALGKLAPLARSICLALAGTAVLSAEPDGDLLAACFGVCDAIVGGAEAVAGAGAVSASTAVGAAAAAAMRQELSDEEACCALLLCLLHVSAGAGDQGASGRAVGAFAGRLAKICSCDGDGGKMEAWVGNGDGEASGGQRLLCHHFNALLSAILGGRAAAGRSMAAGGSSNSGNDKTAATAAASTSAAPSSGPMNTAAAVADERWRKGSTQLAAFDQLCRLAPLGTAAHLDLMVPIILSQLRAPAETDPEVRLAVLTLLGSVMAAPEVTAERLSPHAAALVADALAPNLVWRAGVAAATVRKATVAALYTMLQGGRLLVPALAETAPQLLPVLKTNIEDQDPTTRHLSCLCLARCLEMLPLALGEAPVREIYPELLKRLDDSSDDVRKAACRALTALFAASPPENVRGTVLEYSTEQLLVHLDDQDGDIQESALAVLAAAAAIDPGMVRKKALAARPSHRDPRHCDRLLTQIS